MDPTFGAGHTDLARSLEQLGRTNEAVEEFVRGTAGPDGSPRPSSGLAILYARAGRVDDARAAMQAVLDMEQKQFVSAYGIASYYAVIGENRRAPLRARRNAGVAQGAPTTRWTAGGSAVSRFACTSET